MNELLRLANGLGGKLNKLLTPLVTGSSNDQSLRNLMGVANTISQHRNSIVHQGEFRNRDQATQIIAQARQFVESLVRMYKPKFRLKEKQ